MVEGMVTVRAPPTSERGERVGELIVAARGAAAGVSALKPEDLLRDARLRGGGDAAAARAPKREAPQESCE